MSPVPVVNWSQIATVRSGYGIYVSAQPSLLGAVASSAYTGSILPMTALHPNYTYALTFHGPRFRCGDAKPKIKSNTTTILEDQRDYNGSALESEYSLSVALKDRVFACQMWNVTYSVNFTFVNFEQSSKVTGMQFNERWIYTKPSTGDPCLGGICAFRAWYEAVTAIFEGRISEGASQSHSSTTRLSETALTNCVPNLPFGGPACPTPSLEEAIEIFSENATLSIFGRLQTVYVQVAGRDGCFG